MREKSKSFTSTKFGDNMFERGHILFWTLICDHVDSDGEKFTIGG